MKPGHKYIVKTGYNWRYPDVRKILVLEVTNTSIAYKNLDNNSDYVKRDLLENFNMDYKILEDLGGLEDEILGNLISDMKDCDPEYLDIANKYFNELI